MQKLIEPYEMVSLNNAVLCDSKKAAMREAQRALGLFEQAMKCVRTEAPYSSDDGVRMAA